MYGRHWNSGGIQDIKSNTMSHLRTPNLFPRAVIQLISSLVVESTRQRVEHLRIVPHYQIPPILWNRRWKFLQTWKSYIVNESYLLRGRYLMTHKAVKCKSMAKFVDDIWFKIPEWIQQIRHAHTIHKERSLLSWLSYWLNRWLCLILSGINNITPVFTPWSAPGSPRVLFGFAWGFEIG